MLVPCAGLCIKKTFPETADTLLLRPLGMTRSSFVNPLPEDIDNVAKAHNRSGQPMALPRGYEAMPEMAASGLWTSARDLGRFVAALLRSYRSEGGFLPQPLTIDMMTKVSPSKHGFGPRLKGTAYGHFFHHGRANNSYRAWIEGHLATGDGLVVLTNGTRGDDLYVEIRNAVADTLGWKINQPIHIPVIPIHSEVLADYVGRYEPDPSFPRAHREHTVGGMFDDTFEVIFEAGKLQVFRQGRERKYVLIPTASNRFVMSGFDVRVGMAEIIFHRNGQLKTEAMTLEVSDARSFYRRVPSRESFD